MSVESNKQRSVQFEAISVLLNRTWEYKNHIEHKIKEIIVDLWSTLPFTRVSHHTFKVEMEGFTDRIADCLCKINR